MRQPLTPVEQKVYDYLLDFLSENTYQPSVREIGRQFQIKSTKTVSELLQSLANKGYIERDPSRSRGVKLIGYESARQVRPVPFYGEVAAGEPIKLEEHAEGSITMDRRFLPQENMYFVRADGHSMDGRGIMDGDFLLVAPGREPVSGDIVVARIGENGVVKTYRPRGDIIALVPEHPGEREIEIRPGDDAEVIGTVCGVFRSFIGERVPSNLN